MRHTSALLLASSAMMPRGLVYATAIMAPVPAAILRAADARAATPGLLGVRAEADPIASLATAFEKFKEAHNSRLDAMEDTIAARAAGDRLGGGLGGNVVAVDREYTSTFASYFRRGDTSAEEQLRQANAQGERAQIQASMNVGTNSNGGYLAPAEWDRRITQAQLATSPLRRLATVQPTGVGAYFTLWNDQAWGSGWVGETASRPTTATPGLSKVDFASGEIFAQPAITQTLLDDSQINLEAWLAAQVLEAFNRQEGIAFISGDGVNKPFGLLQYVPGGAADARHPGGNLGITVSGAASTLGATDAAAADGLVTFSYQLGAPYRQNATWLMNSQTAAVIAKLKDGMGNFLWREAFQAGQPPLLLGRPVELDEGMPNIGAGAFPIAYGDFRAGYLINDRMGVRILRDPYTNKPFVQFYVTKRVGAGVADPNAIRLLKISA